jgi:predicted phosphate transport protein (TIGR00153 family)
MPINLFGRLMPPAEDFTKLFCEQVKYISAAAEELVALVDGRGAIDTHVARIRSLEHEADLVARKIFLAANRTFNAPIDREDILVLAHVLDDVVDLIEDASRGIQRYAIGDFGLEMRDMVQAVEESAVLFKQVMPLLDSITKQYRTILSACMRIGQMEGEADECFDSGLGSLRAALRRGEIDVVGYLDRKEVYELLEQLVDKCDDVANTLETIVAKHV